MGKSAKVHKRKTKSKSGASGSHYTSPDTSAAPSSTGVATMLDVQHAKRKAAVRAKASRQRAQHQSATDAHVFGDADYVSVLLGGRRRAKNEAAKLPLPAE